MEPLGTFSSRRWYRSGAPAPYDHDPYCLEPAREQADALGRRHCCQPLAIRNAPAYGICLRWARRRTGQTQVELAVAAGLCCNTVTNLENGHVTRPWKSTHDRLIAALRSYGANDDDLLSLEDAYHVARCS